MVFRGSVQSISVAYPPSQEVTYPDGSKATIFTSGETDEVAFTVLEVFKGAPGKVFQTTISRIGSEGGPRVKEGSEYLVFVTTSGGSKPVVYTHTEALAQDHPDASLNWLRAYATAPDTADIQVGLYLQGHRKGSPAPTVSLTGKQSLTAAPDENGAYAFHGLAPGTYTVAANAPSGMVADDPKTVTVAAKGCAEVFFSLHYDNSIAGTVRDSTGKPVDEVPVAVLMPSHSRRGWDLVKSGSTDADGAYNITQIPPGRYWLALHYFGPSNSDPYATVYYPSASIASDAVLLDIGSVAKVKGIDLVLPEPLHAVTVHARVIRQDGSAVNLANVDAVDTGNVTQFIGAKADEDGRAELKLYDGRQYYLTATTPGTREPACAGPVKFIARDGLTLDTLTLDKSVHECRDDIKLSATAAVTH
jgi:hypothetical protein